MLDFLFGTRSKKDNIYPSYISCKNPKFIEIDGKYISNLIVWDYQKANVDIILKQLIDLNSDITVSIFFEKKNKYKTIKELTYYITNQGASIKDTNVASSDLELLSFSYNDAKYIRKQLQIENDELLNIYMYISIRADSKEELEVEIKKVETVCYFSGLFVRKADFRQLDAYKCCLPLNENSPIVSKVARRNILSSSIGVTYPFILSTINDKNGVLFGKSLMNNTLVLIDRFNKEKYKNTNMCVFGTSGSGKSYFVKLNIIREFLNGTRQFVIDPEREYETVCKFLGGTIIKLGSSSSQYINILDIRESDSEKNYLENKLLRLKSFFYLVFEDLKQEEYSQIEKCLIKTYKEYGITFKDETLYEKQDKETITIKKVFKSYDNMPILEDLWKKLKQNSKLEKFATQLEPFVFGSLKFFNKRTNVNLDSNLIIADIFDLGEENYKYGMCLFIDFFLKKIRENLEIKKLIYIDEIWRIIGVGSNKETAQFIHKIFKTIRKNNGGAVAITQDVQDLFSLENGNYGKSIINNSTCKAIFNLEKESTKLLSKTINITKREELEIATFDKGNMLLMLENEHMTVEVISTPLENNIIQKTIAK